jgi:CO/xanthine dehydrogenase FAD-binding subunit
MHFVQPNSWEDALAAKAAHPEAEPIVGGTDVMVEINFDQRRPTALLDLTRVPEIRQWCRNDGWLRIGAGITYTRLVDELAGELPGLAMASRTVGSPQIRNRATVGGNLGSASPAGDALPPLMADDALVEVASQARGTRRIPIVDFLVGPKKTSLEDDELIAAFWIRPASGPQQFSKIGTRNAMVIAVCSCALALRPDSRRVTAAIGSAAPTPRRALDAETYLTAELAERGLWESRGPLPDVVAGRFAELVTSAAAPIDDVRGSARYRGHALTVLAGRTLAWAWDEFRRK